MPIDVKDGRIYERIAEMKRALGPNSPEVRAALTRIGIKLEGAIKANITRMGLIRTNHLRQSIEYDVDSDRTGDYVLVGSFGVPYARIHEYGGVIRPKRAKYLTIPIHERSRGKTVQRKPRDFELTFFRSPKTNKLLAADKTNGDILFFLTKRVRIKPKRYIKKALDANRGFIYDTIRGVFS